uniref:Uncharacterized protein n=1 Tax=Oryza brachyantha TaxID=4533 RepID=J3LDP0_ORYBR
MLYHDSSHSKTICRHSFLLTVIHLIKKGIKLPLSFFQPFQVAALSAFAYSIHACQ